VDNGIHTPSWPKEMQEQPALPTTLYRKIYSKTAKRLGLAVFWLECHYDAGALIL